MCTQVLNAVTGKKSVETRDHFKNGASPKSQTSRENFLKKTCFALLAVGIVFSGCKKDGYEPFVPSLRYETVPYGSESSVKSGSESYILVFWDYEGEHNHYLYLLGHVRNAPLAYRPAMYYNGVTNIEIGYSSSNVTQESIGSSIGTTKQNSITASASVTSTVSAEVGVKVPFVSAKASASLSTTLGLEASASLSLSNTYETSISSTTEDRDERKVNIGNKGEPAGMYRFALFTTTDVYYHVITDRANTRVVEAYLAFCARTGQFWALDYAPDEGGSFGKTASGELLEIPEIDLSQLPNPPIREEHLPVMVSVQGGTFAMGSPEGIGEENERPQHLVAVSDFNIGKYLITQAQWVAVMGSNPSQFKGDNLPVEMISWNDIVGTSGAYMDINETRYYEDGYIYRLNQLTGKSYRLPTEAEWEYAARGGNKSEGYTYSGSNEIDEVAWYEGNSDEKTHPVGTKTPNELGIYDMSGNVFEWCSDWYGAYNDEPKINPTGPDSGDYHACRGGSYTDYGTLHCRVTSRNIVGNRGRYDDLGLRVVLP